MAVMIRLTRKGKRNRPFYQIVVSDKEHPRDGRHTEKIGHFNPLLNDKGFILNKERFNFWVKQGAKLSDTVRTLVKKHLPA